MGAKEMSSLTSKIEYVIMALITILMILLVISGCAAKQQLLPKYIECPVPISAKWKRPPEGTLQYIKLRQQPKCTGKGTCIVLKEDWDNMMLNLRQTEHARQAMLDQFEALTNPYKKNPLDQFETPKLQEEQSPIDLDLSKIPEIWINE